MVNGEPKFSFLVPPVVSNIIYDKKAMSDLVICKLSKVTSSVAGGEEIILLCEKVCVVIRACFPKNARNRAICRWQKRTSRSVSSSWSKGR